MQQISDESQHTYTPNRGDKDRREEYWAGAANTISEMATYLQEARQPSDLTWSEGKRSTIIPVALHSTPTSHVNVRVTGL